jgi:hypothetical protein
MTGAVRKKIEASKTSSPSAMSDGSHLGPLFNLPG